MVPYSFGNSIGCFMSLLVLIGVSLDKSTLLPDGKYVGSIFFHISFGSFKFKNGRHRSYSRYIAFRQNASDDIMFSDPCIVFCIRLCPSFALGALLTTHAASHLIRFSLVVLPFSKVLNKLPNDAVYFLCNSCKLFVILSNWVWVLASLSSFSIFSPTFLNLSSALRLIVTGRNDTEKYGPITDKCSKRSPVQEPKPFSRFIPPGPGIQAMPWSR